MSGVKAIIAGVGSALPERVLSNNDLEKMVDTSDEWIFKRTGIKNRRIAAEGEFTSHLATAAARDAIKDAGIDAGEIDLVILATSTPDLTMPSTATIVQGALGLDKAAAFDINAACSGFVYGLSTANAFMRSGQSKCALVIGAETMSRVTDWKDRNTCVLFGDGAGAAVMKTSSEEGGQGIIDVDIFASGAFKDLIVTSGGVSSTGDAGVMSMHGQEVFRHASVKMAESVKNIAEKNGLRVEDIDFLVPHQANVRIMSMIAEKLHLPSEKVIVSIENHANTSAASIPIAMAEGWKQGRIRPGHLIAMPALGSGLTWGVALVRM